MKHNPVIANLINMLREYYNNIAHQSWSLGIHATTYSDQVRVHVWDLKWKLDYGMVHERDIRNLNSIKQQALPAQNKIT